MLGKNRIFISHSSQNKDIAEQLCVFLSGLGVDKHKIFCSSIIGQGVDNGEKLNEAIADAISKSGLLVFLLSKDFLASSYCMEELGVGWYLSQTGKAHCFYLVLPDMTLAELQGFVNSKIDKFSFVDHEHRDDLGLFAENLCHTIRIKLPKHSDLLNLENTFFSATQSALNTIIERKEEIQEIQKKQEKEIEQLNAQIESLRKRIANLNDEIDAKDESLARELLLKEYKTIRERFRYLGFGCGISKKEINVLSKQFWMDMVNRYLEIEEKLKIEDRDKSDSMELLLAILFSAYDETGEAFVHVKNYLINNDSLIFTGYLRNVKISYDRHLHEIIRILQDKIANTPRGIVQDSYKETIAELSEMYGKKNE